MADRPIIFSGPMVRAILEDRKVHTRRVIKPQPPEKDGFASNPFKWSRVEQVAEWFHIMADEPNGMFTVRCPYGTPGDRLWVRETFAINEPPSGVIYRATDQHLVEAAHYRLGDFKWVPSIHMPRWASRITLEIAKVRVERVQEISFEDCLAEGVMWTEHWDNVKGADIERLAKEHPEGITVDESIDQSWIDYTRLAFRGLWDSINAKRGFGWEENPWTWVLEFRKAQIPGDGAPSPARS